MLQVLSEVELLYRTVLTEVAYMVEVVRLFERGGALLL
jgi:hypothetical protein